ncbi:hypothetical protein [Pedobacter jamesrossensis]|uniref:Uncharacterized protein n=1 Tax=Pedobacter jamesrossensis TaxID=1908238 RepID=A0ABV8NMP3_9SPHI
MGSVSETGHAKNVANFNTLITYLIGYGTAYNPSNPAILIPNLQAKALQAQTALDNVNTLFAAFKNASSDRELAFEPLTKLSTRIFNALKATNASQQQIENAETHHRKLQGRRASVKLSEEEKASLAAAGKEVNQISATQLSYDNQLDNLDKQIKLLSTISAYTPNEPELQITGLSTLYTNLFNKNQLSTTQLAALNNGRLQRNEIMYNPEIGLVAIATDAKTYAKSVYGANAPQFKLISGIAFKPLN